MSNVPKFIEGSKTLTKPFDKAGEPTLVTSVIATLLPNIPLQKEAMLGKVGEKYTGKSRGFMSNHFAELSKSNILKFKKRDRTWEQGENYQQYMGYIFMEMIAENEQAVDSLKYKLMPKRDAQSVDFITSPTEDIFSKPNQFLDEEEEKPTQTKADNYLD